MVQGIDLHIRKNKLLKKYSDLHIIKTQSLYTKADPK